jgi:hypothetical protein
MLFTGVFQFGYSFYRYNRVMTAASDAALFASKLSFDLSNPDQFKTAVANMLVYGDPGGGTTPVIPGLATSNVRVSLNPIGAMPMDITITLHDFSISGLFKTYTFTDKPRVTTVYMGNIVCGTGAGCP